MGISGITYTCVLWNCDILKVKNTVVKCVLGHRVHHWQPRFNLEQAVHHVGTQIRLCSSNSIGKAQRVVSWALHSTAQPVKVTG
jgi:hypothetical protein